jgi:AraC-like DNA-binding protein
MRNLTENIERDALSDLLTSVRFRSTLLCRSELTAPWGFGIVARDFATFHLALKGGGYLDVDGGERMLRLDEGDLVILPHGNAHAVRDAPTSKVTRLEELIANGTMDARGTLRNEPTTRGAKSTLVCGGFHFEERATSPLLLGLPTTIHIKSGSAPKWVKTAVKFLREESDVTRPGADAVITRLADILFVEALRAHLSSPTGRRSGLAVALRDARVGRALSLIHRKLNVQLSVGRLAREAGMSRTAFALRFAELIGESPVKYATRCRMDHAAALLRSGEDALADVAARVGYESEVGFGRAFKRMVGVSPAAYRRRSRSAR